MGVFGDGLYYGSQRRLLFTKKRRASNHSRPYFLGRPSRRSLSLMTHHLFALFLAGALVGFVIGVAGTLFLEIMSQG